MSFQEKIIEGKYNYFENETPYCEEHFKLFREDKPQGDYTFNAELLSRVETGEFLKVNVNYQLTYQFEPLSLRIKRSLGGKKSSERFTVDPKQKKISYVFSGPKEVKEYEKVVSAKVHIASPSFACSMLMTNHRKIDPVHRTPYEIISSPNIWEYEGPFQETTMHIELMKLDPMTINVHNQELQANYCHIFNQEKSKNPNDLGYPIYISKHYQIPYLAVFSKELKVEIEKLKSFEVNHSKIF